MSKEKILVGNQKLKLPKASVDGGFIKVERETYYKISNYDLMPPFFMSLVSSADHWLFVSSTGGLTAGRINADSALFPYETEDKIAANSEYTGSKTIIRANRSGQSYLWEPFPSAMQGSITANATCIRISMATS